MAKVHPRYENYEYEYEFHEYPMAVYPGSSDGGKTPDPHPNKPGQFLQPCVIVQNDEERQKVLGLAEGGSGELVAGVGGAQRLKTEEDERRALIERAEVLGVQVDKRWGLARLQDAIDSAENPV